MPTSISQKPVKERINEILKILRQEFGDAHIVLNYSNNWELLVTVILSAQCTDKKVNEVTARLFKKYPKLEDYVKVDLQEFESDIRSTGFYHHKAKNILASARLVKEKFSGQIPKTMEELTSLPGVARKTANVVLGNAFGIVEGIAVDTHVGRVTQRLGLTKNSDPVKIENDLMQLLSKKDWFKFTYMAIEFGRHICDAKQPLCSSCPLNKLCPSAFKLSGYK